VTDAEDHCRRPGFHGWRDAGARWGPGRGCRATQGCQLRLTDKPALSQRPIVTRSDRPSLPLRWSMRHREFVNRMQSHCFYSGPKCDIHSSIVNISSVITPAITRTVRSLDPLPHRVGSTMTRACTPPHSNQAPPGHRVRRRHPKSLGACLNRRRSPAVGLLLARSLNRFCFTALCSAWL
jgi:hypothetical protein